ncbi:hypothetical protein DWF74_06060 [Pseudomonas protegens]|nr:hypothetical protein DWF74_06060 [Pseudomonas protegens]PNG37711.1 hypothetical protein A1348_04715 [Pseudomonas protegens]
MAGVLDREQELYQPVKALYYGAFRRSGADWLLLRRHCFVDRLLPDEQLPGQQLGNAMQLL